MAVRPRKKPNAAIKYVSNVARSVRYASLDAIKEYVPVVVDAVDTNADIAKVTYTSIKHSKETVQKAQRALMQSQIGELAVDLKKNLISDLKSGNFYNKKRVDDVNDFAAENFSFGFDTEATGDDDFFGEGFDTEAGGGDSTQTIAEAIDVISERTMDGIANVTIRSAEYQVEASRQANIQLMSQISAGYAQTHGDLSAINANITGIVQFQNEAMVTHFENSRAFYERQQEQMSEQTSILKEMLELQKKSAGIKKDSNYSSKSVSISDIFTSEGALNISEYAKYVGKNIKNMDTGMGDMVKMMLDMGIGKSLTANPIGEIMKGAAKSFLPAYFKESLEQFNESISGAISTALLNITKMQDDFSSPLKQKIGDIFGLNVFNKTKLDVSAYEKGAVSWSGKDHKALTEVIPMLLSDIRSAVTGDETKVYDYEKGRFKKVGSIKKDFDKLKQQEIDSVNSDVMDYLNQQIKRIKFDNEDQEKRLREDINKIFHQSFKYLEYFNPNDAEAYTYGLTDDIGKYNFDLIKKMYKNIPTHKQMSANKNLITAKTRYNEKLKSMEQSGDSVYNMLFNGIFDENTKKKITGTGLLADAKGISTKIDTTNSYFEKLIKQQANYENILNVIAENTSRIPQPQAKKDGLIDKAKGFLGIGKQKTADTKPKTTPASTAREGNTKQQQKTKSSSEQDAAAAAAAKPKENKPVDIQDSIKSSYGSKVDDMVLYIDPNEKDAKVGPELIKKLEESETATKKIGNLIKGTITFAQAPLELFGGVLRKVDQRMYTLLFGSSKKKDEDKPIIDRIKDGFTNFFKDLKSNAVDFWDELKRGKTADKIRDKLDETIHSMFGYTMEEFKAALFGEKNKNKSLGDGLAGLFKQGFKEIKTNVKNFFKTDEEIFEEQMAGIKGEKTKEGKEKAKKRKSNKIIAKVTKAAQEELEKNKPKDAYGKPVESKKKKKTDEDDGTGEVENAATGVKRVKKTGVIAVSEGEMIIPPDMNPYNITKRYANENEAIDKFNDAYDLNYSIPSFAKGGVVGDDRRKKLDVKAYLRKAIANGKITPDEALSYIMEKLHFDNEKDAKTFIKFLGPDIFNFIYKANARRVKNEVNDPIREDRSDYVKGKEHIKYKMADEAKSAADAVAREMNGILKSVLGADVTKSFSDRLSKAYKNDKIKSAAADTVLNFRDYLPSTLAGGATGAGLSLLLGAVGGPLVWGAVGGGLGLLSKSNKLQELLFGELAEDENGNVSRNGKGILPEKLVKGINKYAKTMVKTGAIGAVLSSTILPGGPITGLMVGSALGYAQRNEKIQDYLFGEEGKLKDLKTVLSAKLPRMGVGGAAGLLVGPFGPLTNMIIGAGIGMVSDTNVFKDAIFGSVSGDGKRYGGLVGFIKESLEIPANMLIQTISEFKDAVLKDIVDPLKEAGRALAQGVKNIGTSIVDMIANSFEDHVTRPIGAFMTEKVIRPLEQRIGGFIKKIFGGAWKVATSPFRAAGALGKMVQGRQLDAIGKGGGTAAERIARRDLMDRDSKLAKTKGWINDVTGINIFNEAKRTDSIGNKVDVAAVDMSAEDLTKFTIAGEALDSRLGKRRSIERIAKEELLKGGLSKFLDTYRWRKDDDGTRMISARELKLIKDELVQGSCKNAIKLIETNPRIPEQEKEIIIGIFKDAVKRRDAALKSAKDAKKISDEFEKKYGFRMEDRNVQRVFRQQLKDIESAKTSKFEDELNGRREHEDEKNLAHSMAVEFKLDQKHKEVTDIMKDMLDIMKGKMPKEKNKSKQLGLPGPMGEPIARADGSVIYANGPIAQSITDTSRLLERKEKESKSVMTENGIILLKRDRQGNEQPDERDSETRLTLRRRDQKEETQKGILAKIGSLGDTMQNAFFGEKDEKKPSLLSKILKVGAGIIGLGAGLLGTKGAAILGALGLTTIAGMKIKVAKRDSEGNVLRDENGNVIKEESTVGDAVYKAVERLWLGKDLTGNTSGMYYSIKGFTRDHLIPAVGAGIDWLSERLPGAIESGISVLGNLAGDIAEHLISGLIAHAPQIIWGGIKGIASGVMALVKGERETQTTEEIESKYKFTPSNAVVDAKGTSPSSKAKQSNVTLAMQNAFDDKSSTIKIGNYGSAKVDSHKNLTTSVQANIAKATGNSTGQKVDKDIYSQSKAYKNLSKNLRSKADQSLGDVWNNDSGYGKTIGELLNDDVTIIGYVTDEATGEQIPVTGADILKYPDVAKQFGIDMHLSNEERDANAERSGANASKKSILENNIGRSIVTGGKYGLSSGITRKIGNFIGGAVEKGGKIVGNGIGKIPGLKSKAVGGAIKGASYVTGGVVRTAGYASGLAKDFGTNLRNTGSLRGALSETGNIIKGDLASVAARYAENNPDSWLTRKGSKFFNKAKDFSQAWNGTADDVLRYGADAVDDAGNVIKSAGENNKITKMIANSADDVVESTALNTVTKTAKNATKSKGKLGELATKFLDYLKKIIAKFFADSKFIAKLKKVIQHGAGIKNIAEKKIADALTKFGKELIEKASEKLAGKAVKGLGTACAKLGSYIGSGGLIAVAFVVSDFLSGWNKADVTFKVLKPNLGERFISGLLKALLNTCFLSLIIDEKDLVNKIIELLQLLGVKMTDLEKRQQEAEEACKEYNLLNSGANVSVEDYLASQHLSSKIKQAIKNKASDFWNLITGKSSDKDEEQEKADNIAKKIEKSVDNKEKFYDNEGNLVGEGMDENGYIETMYVPQGSASMKAATNNTKSTGKKKKGGIWSKIKSIFDKKKDDIDNMPSSDSNIKGDNYKASAQDISNATSGYGNIISDQNQSNIKGAVEEVNNSIPKMIKSLKENLASYFGLKGSDLSRANKVGENTLRNKGPLQVFKQLNNMWRNIAVKTNPILSLLPDSMESGLSNVSRFLAIALGMADPGDTGVDINTITQSNSYLNTRAEMIADSSPIYSLLSGDSGTNSNNSSVQRKTVKTKSTSSKAKKSATANKVTSSKKKSTLGSIIGKILGTGKGSGISDNDHQIDRNPAEDRNNFISQKYGQYANKAFTVTGDKERTKVSDAGCAPAVATMASKLVGLSTPIDMNQAIKDALPYKQPNEGVSADYFVDEFDKHNIQTSFITNQNSDYEKTIKNRLAASKPVILMGQDEKNKSKAESPFGSTAHYVLATKLDKNGNDVYINDPEAKKPNIKYNLKKVLGASTLGILPNMARGIKGAIGKSKNQLKNALKLYSAMGKYGSDTMQYKVFAGLRQRGFDELHACAIMGNIQAESGFNPNVVEGGSGIGFGLCQWSFGRRSQIEAYASSKGKSAGDLNIQLDFLKAECTPGGGCDGHASYSFMSTNYEGRSWPADTFNSTNDIETATKAFCYCWERPNAIYAHTDTRVAAAKEFYQEFTGTPISDSSDSSSDDSGGGAGEKKSGGTIIDKIISAFTAIGSAYGLSGDGSDDSGDIDSGGSVHVSTGDISGNVSSDPEIAKKQKEVVAMMKSKEGQLAYSQSQRNPDYGSGDCSSTIQWAYQKVTGKDVGSWTGAMETAPTTYTVATSTADESKLQLGDIILKDGHVEMYYGDGKMIGHGGGATGTVPGPTISNLGGTPPYNHIKRLNEFKGKGSGLPFVSQRDSRYANKSIGDEKVADAGCAPAVATMAVNALTGKGGLNMNTAIKNASSYKDNGGVTADYFADEFANHGIDSDYVTGDNLYRSISSGSPTVLLGRDSQNKSKTTSPFGSTNHYVLANGMSKDGRSVYINDPEGKRGNIKYPASILKNSVMGVAPRAGGSKIIDLAKRKLKRFSGGATKKILYVGDSRTVGMQSAVSDENVEFIGQVGAGLSWLQSTAISQVNAKVSEDTSYNVVFCFGVNDLGNVNNYINFYKNWKNSHSKVKVWFMSVNPVTKPCSVSNDQISNFNTTLKGSGLGNYIDTYNHIKDSATASDGLHYDTETYKKIHQYVVSTIGGGSGDSSGSASVTGDESSSGGSVMNQATSAITSLANAWFGGFLDSDTSSSDESATDGSGGDASVTGDSTGVDRSPGGKDERALTGSTSYPTYDLNSSTKTLVAKLITGETGGYDAILAKQKASMLANVNEVGYGRASTADNLRTTMNKYPKSSLQKGATQTAKTAVEEVLVKGKRTLPRYVTVEGKFPGSVKNAKDRSNYKRGDNVTSTGGSKYKFYNFMGASKNGNISGYFDGNYDKYKGDVVWAGAGSGLMDDIGTTEGTTSNMTQSTPSFDFLNNGGSSVAQKINAINVNATSTTDKLIELVIKLLGQVVDNTVSIKDIAKLLTQYLKTKGTDQANISNSDYDSVKKQILSTNDNLLQTMSEITQSQNVQTLEKLIANVESIAAM